MGCASSSPVLANSINCSAPKNELKTQSMAPSGAGGEESGVLGEEWQATATELASSTVPFVPARVSTAFAQGSLTACSRSDFSTAEQDANMPTVRTLFADLVSPTPRVLSHAALLIVDVSGFTALSEDAKRRLGSEGVERFSLAMSAFFGVMMDTIASCHGDVDCFAGDAVLVVFVPRDGTDSGNSGYPLAVGGHDCSGAGGGLQEALCRALKCAQAVHDRLDGFQQEPEDPPLSMHSALAAGELICLECGGTVARRSEAFVLGTPLSDIAAALGESKRSEIVLAPSAVQLWAPKETGHWAQRRLPSGHLVLYPGGGHHGQLTGLHGAAVARLSSQDFDKSRSLAQSEVGSLPGPQRSSLEMEQRPLSVTQMRLVRKVVSFMHEIETARSSSLLVNGDSPTSGRSIMAASPSWQNFSARHHSYGAGSLTEGSRGGNMGLDALLRFVPECVRSNCLAGHRALSTLMEHRVATILFIVADMKEHEHRYTDSAWLSSLQEVLGKSIDVVEAQLGGATRQITVDDKGLAMIFVFGLPGYRGKQQCTPAILAARKVLDLLSKAEVSGTAGITSGTCFCGLVGDPRIRCEYAVMGDIVNTAARLAVAAAKQGTAILCSEDVARATWRRSSPLASHQLTLHESGSIKLKGKQGEARVFRPEVVRNDGGAGGQVGSNVDVVGRDAEMEVLREVLRRRTSRITTVVVEGDAGMGKSTVVEQLIREGKDWEGLEELPSLLLRGREDAWAPFSACQSVLRWWLEMHGEADADRLSWLLDDFDLGENLPPLLRRHASAIGAVRIGLQDRMGALRALYADILWDALRERPVVVLLEDMEKLDCHSLNVMCLIARRLQQDHASGDIAADVQHTQRGTVILCTARHYSLLCDGGAVGMLEPGRALPETPEPVLCLHLRELDDSKMAEIARAFLGQSLAEPVVSLIVERASGVPLQAVELCEWMLKEDLLEEGRLSAKAAGVDLESLVPPSMQAVVQAQIDQLPTAPGVVLRWASVWGDHFHTGALLDMLPKGLVCGLEGLEEQLEVLMDAHMIQRADKFECSHSIGGHAGDAWQFCNNLQQEVVYTIMPHKYRRRLHCKAAVVVKKQLAKVGDGQKSRPFLKALTRHLLLSARASTNASLPRGSSFRRMSEEDTTTLAQALGRAAEISTDVGDYCEAVSYRTQQLDVLKQQNILTNHSLLPLLTAESAAAIAMTNAIQTVMAFDPSMMQKSLGDPVDRLAELATRQQELQAAMSELVGDAKEAYLPSPLGPGAPEVASNSIVRGAAAV